MSLCTTDEHGALVDFDPIPGGFRACASMFEQGEWIVFNAGFELRWFIDAGSPDVACRDVGYLRRAIMGGGQFALKQLISWDLGREMDKTEQASDWSDPDLTESQLEYAYNDAARDVGSVPALVRPRRSGSFARRGRCSTTWCRL